MIPAIPAAIFTPIWSVSAAYRVYRPTITLPLPSFVILLYLFFHGVSFPKSGRILWLLHNKKTAPDIGCCFLGILLFEQNLFFHSIGSIIAIIFGDDERL